MEQIGSGTVAELNPAVAIHTLHPRSRDTFVMTCPFFYSDGLERLIYGAPARAGRISKR